MPSLVISSITAALLLLMLIGLDVGVIQRRLKAQISLETGGDAIMVNRVRAQANFTEHAPLALIGLGLVELAGAAAPVLWAIAGTLLVGRAAHAFGMYTGVLAGRQSGMILTFISLATSAVVLLLKFLA
jgi:uncharacterized membrane protein YecN with MAPEG domain